MIGRVLTGIEDFDADFVSARGSDFNVLDLERLSCGPADGGLALDDLTSGGHGGVCGEIVGTLQKGTRRRAAFNGSNEGGRCRCFRRALGRPGGWFEKELEYS